MRSMLPHAAGQRPPERRHRQLDGVGMPADGWKAWSGPLTEAYVRVLQLPAAPDDPGVEGALQRL